MGKKLSDFITVNTKTNDSGASLSSDDLAKYMSSFNFDTLYNNNWPTPYTHSASSPSGDGRSDWQKTTLYDLQLGDEVVVVPDFCGLIPGAPGVWYSKDRARGIVDGLDYPVWGGANGRLVGTVVDITTDTNPYGGRSITVKIHWQTGEQTFTSVGATSAYIKDFGLVLYKLFAPTIDPKITLTVNAQSYPIKSLSVDMAKEPKRPTFDDVILDQKKKDQVMEAIQQVNNHDLIFNEWGFGDKIEKGRAVSMLYYGPAGVGKTMLGQAIANHLDYKLQVISTAEIESQEPGGAERALKSFFEAAEKNKKTVLLFDEVDSLIHDRSSVGMILGAQINALLTELEKYSGIAIFTTNRLGVLDSAFERRLSLKLEFTLPNAKQRLKIWRNMFPEKAPLADDIRWEGLAQAEIAGGHVKNIVLKAARRAANGGKVITDSILWDCLEEEVESMEAYHNPLYPRLSGGSNYAPDVTGGINKTTDTMHGAKRRS